MGREPGHGPSNIKDVESEKNCQIAQEIVGRPKIVWRPQRRDIRGPYLNLL